MRKDKLTKEERIKLLSDALKKDKAQKKLSKENDAELLKLQKLQYLHTGKKRVKIEDEIIQRSKLVFDFSDDLTLASVRELIINLKKELDNGK